MKSDSNLIGFRTELEQSELAGDSYSNFFKAANPRPAIPYLMQDVSDIYCKILQTCNCLTGFQMEKLARIFGAFNDIRKNIDPNRLKSFDYTFTSDSELILFRNTDKALINLIIDSDEVIALSIIPKNPDQQKSLTFYDADYDDFEGLSYLFFS